ncbi:MAG: hypothetical protein CR993_03060 [Rhodobacterales bacterium]|nr:MAG: hypothetical protein CR993_03060 [Rhodobacterales bacterium]
MTPERGRELRREAVAYGEMEMAGRAVRAMGDLLWEAQILSESDGGTGEYARTIDLGNRPLCLQFGSYRAKVRIIKNAFSFECEEEDCEGPQYGVRAGHLGITLHVDVRYSV